MMDTSWNGFGKFDLHSDFPVFVLFTLHLADGILSHIRCTHVSEISLKASGCVSGSGELRVDDLIENNSCLRLVVAHDPDQHVDVWQPSLLVFDRVHKCLTHPQHVVIPNGLDQGTHLSVEDSVDEVGPIARPLLRAKILGDLAPVWNSQSA